MSQFGEFISKSTLGAINVGLHSASDETMRSLLGHPKGTLTEDCQNDLASDTVQRLSDTRNFGLFRATGIKPALDSLQRIIDAVREDNPQLLAAIGSAGMLCVRLRRPTSGAPSSLASNHAWGTAIDITIDGVADTTADESVQRGIAELIPFFNDEGWFSGVGFASSEDDTHFEVSEEVIQSWAKDKLFDPPKEPAVAAAVAGESLARRAFDFFFNTRWSKEQAAGLVANIEAESSFKADEVGDSGLAYGLCQWHPDRQADFAAAFDHSIKESTFDDQLKFINFELREGKEMPAGRIIAAAATALEAGAAVSVHYERPLDKEGNADRRGKRAEEIFAQFCQTLVV